MTSQPQAPQPSAESLIATYEAELSALHSDRIHRMALFEDLRREAQDEINRLGGVIASIVSLVADEDNRSRIKSFLGEHQITVPDPSADRTGAASED